ncbi:Glucosaminyl phosphatidylinositol (GlcN-PI) nositol acylation protein [Malassezia cuniculi]|uniref:ATP synthase subunit 5, mitochondrial n=1 Tax=Malassezia cuniculi TaxID=948313 RepID=A0AAF0J7V2_9BASI|nr:Glucosaminyl phosphatidylinositol (GlcN-PI) nositol acylation protein [Malassezia cuniculi]
MASRFVPRALTQTRGYASQAVKAPRQLEGIAGKYATAAYVSALSKSDKTLAKVETDLKSLDAILKAGNEDSAQFRNFLSNPTLGAGVRTQAINDILSRQKGGADEITKNLFATLAENHRLGFTEKVIEGFLELVSAHRGEVEIVVTSAKPLDKSITSRLESALKSSQFAKSDGAKSLKVSYKINESLLGGFQVDLGDRSVDLSVANRVNKLNALLRPYKSAKEQWIAHQSGGSVWHINAVCGVALASLALCVLIDRQPLWWRTGVHGAVLLFPLLAATTVFADHLLELYIVLGALIAVYYAAGAKSSAQNTSERDERTKSPNAPLHSPSLSFLSAYRAYMMIITVICILAVDFHVFPRQFAKCETWGTSLMDLGVGSFAVSHGTVSIGRQPWRKTFRRMLPLLVLGAVRVALVKGTEYPEHVSEYGVHWNFFITLACVLPAMDAVQRVVPVTLFPAAAVFISAAFEAVLRSTHLQDWAVSDTRDAHSLVSLNKEGIVSLVGYLALGIVGLDLGHVIRARNVRNALFYRCALYWGLFLIAQQMLAPSRRLANLPYVLWNAAFNASFILAFYAISNVLAADVPHLLKLINRRSLVVFLGANLATGAVNLSLRTMDCGTKMSSGRPVVSPQSRLDLLISANRAYATDSAVTLHDAISGNTAAQQARQARAQAHAKNAVDQKRDLKFAEYAAKLKAKAEAEGLASVDELRAKVQEEEAKRAEEQRLAFERARKESIEKQMSAEQERTQTIAERDQALQERLRRQRAEAEKRKLESGNVGNSPIKPLSSFLNVEKIAGQSPDVISQLWTTYHTMSNKLSAVVPRETYEGMLETAREFPQFVIPLPKSEKNDKGETTDAYEMYFMQWAMLPQPGAPASAPTQSAVLFTPLAEYKLRQEFAQPALVLTNYTDLAPEKGLVLLRGDITNRQHDGVEGAPMISQAEAQILAMCMQRFYRTTVKPTADEDAGAAARRELLHNFGRAPEKFALDKLLEVAFQL